MADEATIRSSLTIVNGNLNYRSFPSEFKANVAGTLGPTPGAFSASLAGVDVDFSELTTPSLCRITNLDVTNFVEVGIWDGLTFYPVMDVLAGEWYVFRLAASLTEEFGTGTGTTGAAVNTFRIKADTAACNVVVEAFEV